MEATKKPQIEALLNQGETNAAIALKIGASVVYIGKLRKKLGIVATPVVKVPKVKAEPKAAKVKAAEVKDKPTSVKTAPKTKSKEAKIETNPAKATSWSRTAKK